MSKITVRSNFADCVSGERIFAGDEVIDTGFKNVPQPYLANSRTRLIKEATIVALAEAAGLHICNGDCNRGNVVVDAGVSKPAPVVERPDAGVGGGKSKVGKSKAGGSKAGGHSDGPVEGE